MNQWLQIPFLTGEPQYTALAIGVLGGAAGPAVVAGVLKQLARRFTGGSGDKATSS